MPVPGTRRRDPGRRPSAAERAEANRGLEGFAAWASTVQGGGG